MAKNKDVAVALHSCFNCKYLVHQAHWESPEDVYSYCSTRQSVDTLYQFPFRRTKCKSWVSKAEPLNLEERVAAFGKVKIPDPPPDDLDKTISLVYDLWWEIIRLRRENRSNGVQPRSQS